MSSAAIGRPKSLAQPSLAGSSPVSIFIDGRFAAAVRPAKSEDFTATNAKADLIDRDKLTEAARQAFRLDRRDIIVRDRTGSDDDLLMHDAFFGWQKVDKGFLQSCRASLASHFRRTAGRDDPTVIHGGEPVKAFGLVHVSSGDDDAHLGPAPRWC